MDAQEGRGVAVGMAYPSDMKLKIIALLATSDRWGSPDCCFLLKTLRVNGQIVPARVVLVLNEIPK
jgi:hypothetical protein